MKPTELLALNLSTLPAAIIQWRVTPDVPKRANIGRDATGQFCTAQLKEYPPAFAAHLHRRRLMLSAVLALPTYRSIQGS